MLDKYVIEFLRSLIPIGTGLIYGPILKDILLLYITAKLLIILLDKKTKDREIGLWGRSKEK